MVSTRILFSNMQDESGENDINSVENLIGKTNTIANHVGNIDFLLATSILLMFFKSI